MSDATRHRFGPYALIAALLLTSAALRAQGTGSAPPPPQHPQMMLHTDAFEDGARMPGRYTGLQPPSGVSPDLSWSSVPAGTQSFVLLMHDAEEAPNRSSLTDPTHWLLWNIPGNATGLPEGVPEGAQLPDGTRQVSQHSNGYRGPGPNPGANHHYVFELFALDVKLDVPVGPASQVAALRKAVFEAMDGHVIGKATLVGRSARIPVPEPAAGASWMTKEFQADWDAPGAGVEHFLNAQCQPSGLDGIQMVGIQKGHGQVQHLHVYCRHDQAPSVQYRFTRKVEALGQIDRNVSSVLGQADARIGPFWFGDDGKSDGFFFLEKVR